MFGRCLMLLMLTGMAPISILGQNDLEYFRETFHQMETREEHEAFFNVEIETQAEADRNVIMAYKGVCQSMMAKFAFSPFTKMKYFKEGTSLLEKSIETDANVENIYLRLLTQLNTPRMLSYRENIPEDILFLQHNMVESNLPLKEKRKMLTSLLKTRNSDRYIDSLKKIRIE